MLIKSQAEAPAPRPLPRKPPPPPPPFRSKLAKAEPPLPPAAVALRGVVTGPGDPHPRLSSGARLRGNGSGGRTR